jgi:hypothetical protein
LSQGDNLHPNVCATCDGTGRLSLPSAQDGARETVERMNLQSMSNYTDKLKAENTRLTSLLAHAEQERDMWHRKTMQAHEEASAMLTRIAGAL